jgi:hypothetical protein
VSKVLWFDSFDLTCNKMDDRTSVYLMHLRLAGFAIQANVLKIGWELNFIWNHGKNFEIIRKLVQKLQKILSINGLENSEFGTPSRQYSRLSSKEAFRPKTTIFTDSIKSLNFVHLIHINFNLALLNKINVASVEFAVLVNHLLRSAFQLFYQRNRLIQ